MKCSVFKIGQNFNYPNSIRTDSNYFFRMSWPKNMVLTCSERILTLLGVKMFLTKNLQ